MRRTTPLIVAAGTALALGLAACGGSSGGGGNPTSAFNAATTKVLNPSTAQGGVLRMAKTGDWDNVDGADTYYAYSWNFARLYGRALTMFKPAPGGEGLKLVPDLATDLGKASSDAKTWTYTIRQGVTFEDGTPVTSKDVKYAVERTIDSNTFPNGPSYFRDYLDLQGYAGPYKDKSPDKLGLKAIETPDDHTIVFHLKKPFASFDYMAMLPGTIPVPQAKDTGALYKQHVVSTGPYMFQNYTPGKSMTLVKNPKWSPATDPYRKQLVDKIEVQLGVNADDIDNRLINGGLDMDVTGTGVQPAAQPKILSNPAKKQYSDAALTTRTWFFAISPSVKPFDNIHCRRAVQYATDKVAMQTAWGGPVAGGDLASHMLPPQIPGVENFDLYSQTYAKTGGLDQATIDKAKQELTSCGQPNGFKTVLTARAERNKEVQAAEALQQGLAKVGIQAEIKKFPEGDYFKLYAGKPDFVKKNGLGLMMYGWGADWPDGFGFLSQIVDSRTIRDAGNTNLGVKDPEIDKMIDKANGTLDATARNALWAQIDRKVMDDAYYVPFIFGKGLLYRPPNLTNVFVNQGFSGEYDYLSLGVK